MAIVQPHDQLLKEPASIVLLRASTCTLNEASPATVSTLKHDQHRTALGLILQSNESHLQPAVSFHKLEHVPAGGVFHCDGQVCGSEEDLLELDDVRMTKIAVANDFPLNVLCDLIAPLEQFIGQIYDKLNSLSVNWYVKESLEMDEQLRREQFCLTTLI